MDRFFTDENCDRCKNSLESGRTMSWFTEEAICMDCSSKERELRGTLPKNGFDYEGCGYIPEGLSASKTSTVSKTK